MDRPAEQSTAGNAIVWVVIVGSILALASWISGFPWNYLGQ
jgi:hypothetical protein